MEEQTSSLTPASDPTSFLDLPAEVRLQIYCLVFENIATFTLELRHRPTFAASRPKAVTNLLRTCWTCRREGTPIFLDRATVGMWASNSLGRLESTVGPAFMPCVKRVKLDFFRFRAHPNIIHRHLPGLQQIDYICSDEVARWCRNDRYHIITPKDDISHPYIIDWFVACQKETPRAAKFTGKEDYKVTLGFFNGWAEPRRWTFYTPHGNGGIMIDLKTWCCRVRLAYGSSCEWIEFPQKPLEFEGLKFGGKA